MLEELEERIESFQAKIDYNDQQIVAIAGPTPASVATPAESADTNDAGTALGDHADEDADGVTMRAH